jgi:SMC interacting uncharacterized protein involved in chromosome segregation
MSEEYCNMLNEKIKECYKCPIEMCDAVCILQISFKKWQNDCDKYTNQNAIKHKKKSFINKIFKND